jgi:shikimate kinase
MIMLGEWERMKQEVFVIYFQVPLQYLFKRAEKNHTNPHIE